MSTVSQPRGQHKEIPSDGLCHHLRQRLAASRHPGLISVSVEEKHGHVVLRGQVNRFYHKQLAQSIVMQTVGVRTVTNEIQVGSPDATQPDCNIDVATAPSEQS